MVHRLQRAGHQCVAFDRNVESVKEVSGEGATAARSIATSLLEQPSLEKFTGRVSDSGEGRWTILAAIETTAPAPVLTASLFERFASRGEDNFARKLL